MWVFSRSARYRLHSSADRVEPYTGCRGQQRGGRRAFRHTRHHAAHDMPTRISWWRHGAHGGRGLARRCCVWLGECVIAPHLWDAGALVVPGAAQLEQVRTQVLTQQPDDAVACHALVHHLPTMVLPVRLIADTARTRGCTSAIPPRHGCKWKVELLLRQQCGRCACRAWSV